MPPNKTGLAPIDVKKSQLSNSAKYATIALIDDELIEKQKWRTRANTVPQKKKKRHQQIVLFVRNLLIIIKTRRKV